MGASFHPDEGDAVGIDPRLSPVVRALVELCERVPRDLDEAQALQFVSRPCDENDPVSLFLTGELDIDAGGRVPGLRPRPGRRIEDVDATEPTLHVPIQKFS